MAVRDPWTASDGCQRQSSRGARTRAARRDSARPLLAQVVDVLAGGQEGADRPVAARKSGMPRWVIVCLAEIWRMVSRYGPRSRNRDTAARSPRSPTRAPAPRPGGARVGLAVNRPGATWPGWGT